MIRFIVAALTVFFILIAAGIWAGNSGAAQDRAFTKACIAKGGIVALNTVSLGDICYDHLIMSEE